MNLYRKAHRVAKARLDLATVIDATGGDVPANADLAAAESNLYRWLERLPEHVKVALREYFGAEHIP